MCPSAASINATLPGVSAAPASSAGSPAATVPHRRPSRDLKAARALNKGRHERRDPALAIYYECRDCWSYNGRTHVEHISDNGSRCGACRDYIAGRINADTWMRRILRTHDKRLTNG